MKACLPRIDKQTGGLFMSELFAIVVDVEEPKRKCFIAFPFDKEGANRSPEITRVISEAVNKENLTPLWSNETPAGVKVVEYISSAIRGANMVIAVCTPEETTGKANPNVMYELGIADALGKPTLMVTSDLKTLPFDVQSKQAFRYRENELASSRGRAELLERLRGYIDNLKKQTSPDHGLVLQHLPDVWVLHADHRIVLTKSFWAYARSAFKLADRLHEQGAPLALRMQKLHAFFNTSQRKPSKVFAWHDFEQEWQSYKDFHTNWLEPYLDPAAKEREDMHHCLAKLRAERSAPPDLISRLVRDYEHLRDHIGLYNTAFNEANLLVGALPKAGGRNEALYHRIDQLKQKTESFNRSVNVLIKNLKDEINDRFYTRERAVAAAV